MGSFDDLLKKVKDPYYQVLQEISFHYVTNGHGAIDDGSSDKIVAKLKKRFKISSKSRGTKK